MTLPANYQTITHHNPWNGKTWEEVIPTPEMNLHPNAVILIVDGEVKIHSKTIAAAMKSQGSIIINDPKFKH